MDTRQQQTATPDVVSDHLVGCLEAEGVDYVFGIPGEGRIPSILSQPAKVAAAETAVKRRAGFAPHYFFPGTDAAGLS